MLNKKLEGRDKYYRLIKYIILIEKLFSMPCLYKQSNKTLLKASSMNGQLIEINWEN